MDDLIPSKQISDYLKEKNVEFTDFEKATLIFNNKFLSKDTKHQKLINFKGNPDCIGKRVMVKVTEAKTWALKGEQIEQD